MNISKALDKLKCDLIDVGSIAENMYNYHFQEYFRSMREWYSKFLSTSQQNVTNGISGVLHGSVISDSELEEALTTLPLQLFSASEELSKFKLDQEVIKLRIKELEAEAKANKIDNPEIDEDKLIQSIYSSIISRVESEISFSREFIMVMKKFWDSRRSTEAINPVSEHVSDLPEYDIHEPGSLL